MNFKTLRAVLAFGTVSLVLIGYSVHVAFRELNLRVQAERMRFAQEEATRIAEAVAALGRDESGIDFSQLRRKLPTLDAVIRERMETRPYVRYVEIRDRFDGRLVTVAKQGQEPWPLGDMTEEGGRTGDVVVAELRRGAEPQGEVRVGIAEGAFQRKLRALRRGLRLQLLVAAALVVAVLAAGLGSVVYLIRKNRKLEQSRLAAERRSYVGLLASGLAHEIRNPLNAMNMNLQMLEEELQGLPGLEGGDHGELLDSTKSEIGRLESLVNNFLTYARPSDPHFASHDLNRIVGEVAKFLAADFSQSGVQLQLELEPLLPSVEIDETQFKQSLMNLLVNARQVLKNRGRVVVATRAGAAGDVVVEVADDGPGIPREFLGRIFHVFESRRGGGTGLGLPIAKQIVERHGGSLEVESEVGEGTTFTIRLPRSQRSAVRRPPGQGEEPPG